MKKLFAERGETIAETLLALLIVSLVFVFLTNSVVAAANINANTSKEDAVFRTGTADGETVRVTITDDSILGFSSKMDYPEISYSTDKITYYYYEP